MSREKQISAMAKILTGYEGCGDCQNCKFHGICGEELQATNLYDAGYHARSEGEWVETEYKTVEHGFVERRGKAWLCTNCRHASKEFHPNMKFCPNCGAKMEGGN
jgi:hypothetical protein